MDELVVGGVTRVVIGRDLLEPDAVLGHAMPAFCGLVTQPGAAHLADRVADGLAAAGIRTQVYPVADRDVAKSLATVEAICRGLAEAGATRDDMVVGVGGGAVTDLAGFVGSVFLRGVRVHFVPTTLLAAIDASIGGKSGVNVGGKNLIGAFRHPERVVIDLSVLEALPSELIREGLAEALKAGLVGDPGLFELIERDGQGCDLAEVVTRAVAVKARIVGEDFEERGVRTHLNYGHTVGHALEAITGMPHGEAVAVGMVAAGRVSVIEARFDGEERQRAAIARLGLPTQAPGVDRAELLSRLRLDKKHDAHGLRMVVLEAVGRPLVRPVGSATVGAALAAVGISGGES